VNSVHQPARSPRDCSPRAPRRWEPARSFPSQAPSKLAGGAPAATCCAALRLNRHAILIPASELQWQDVPGILWCADGASRRRPEQGAQPFLNEAPGRSHGPAPPPHRRSLRDCRGGDARADRRRNGARAPARSGAEAVVSFSIHRMGSRCSSLPARPSRGRCALSRFSLALPDSLGGWTTCHFHSSLGGTFTLGGNRSHSSAHLAHLGGRCRRRWKRCRDATFPPFAQAALPATVANDNIHITPILRSLTRLAMLPPYCLRLRLCAEHGSCQVRRARIDPRETRWQRRASHVISIPCTTSYPPAARA
jgi:hypothetical protein